MVAAVRFADDDRSKVHASILALATKKAAWRDLGAAAKLGYLSRIREAAERHGAEWAANSAGIRGITPDGPTPHLEGAAWLAALGTLGPPLTGFIRTYQGLAATGMVPRPPRMRTRRDGQKVFTVFPTTAVEKIYGAGVRGEVWLEPGAEGSQGSAWRASAGGVSAILGAGNFEAPTDILTKMFGENEVVIYKPNPVNGSNAEYLLRVLAPLVEDGFLAIVEGGVEVGQAMVASSAVDDVMMTGAAATYDRIVWGPPDEQASNKRSGNKLMTKPFHAELGGCAPVIVVPGEWTSKELDHHAAQIAAAKVMNGSHICASPQVLVLDGGWPQREVFLARLRHHLAAAPNDGSYYPDSAAKQNRFRAAYPTAESIPPKDQHLKDQLPRLLVANVPRDSLATRQEAFCPVLVEVLLDGGSAREFLDSAIDYCNEELAGSLSATLLVDPRSARSLGVGVDDAVAKLRYGAIGVNVWGAMPVFFPGLTWGAHPGHSPEDIQSGMGVLNNTYLLDGVQKSVCWTPFVHGLHPKPQTARDKLVNERLSRVLANPSAGRLAQLLSGVMFGL